jgi:hypothetical protein
VYPQGSGTPVSGYPETANLTPTSAGCTSTLATTECTLVLGDLSGGGTYTMSLVTYDETGGTGNALSQATMPFTIVEGQNNTVTVTLGGVPVSVTMVPSGIALSGSITSGYTLSPNHAATMSVFGLDADGNPIVGPGQGTIAVSSSGGTGSLTITEPTTTSPNQVTLKSTTAVTGVTLTATLTPDSTTGLGAVTATASITSPAPDTLYIPNYTVTGGGYGSIGVFDEEGNAIATSGSFPGVYNPNSIAYDTANGWLYVSNIGGSSGGGGSGSITAYDDEGNLQTTSFSSANNVQEVAYDATTGFIYVLYSNGGTGNNGTVVAFNATGSVQTLTGAGFPNLAGPTALTVDTANGWIYVENGNETVTAYDAEGNRKRSPETSPVSATLVTRSRTTRRTGTCTSRTPPRRTAWRPSTGRETRSCTSACPTRADHVRFRRRAAVRRQRGKQRDERLRRPRQCADGHRIVERPHAPAARYRHPERPVATSRECPAVRGTDRRAR